jgi:serine/threonine protein kinase
MDASYFKLLESSMGFSSDLNSIHTSDNAGKTSNNENLSSESLNQGYYRQFFKEVKSLGRGYRGSVYHCEHIIDNLRLGTYAVKKIAVGDNHSWLKRMIKEVEILERAHHPNIIEYRHSWVESHQFSKFGPPVPCLFILMELANGGNLEDYVLTKTYGNSMSSRQFRRGKELSFPFNDPLLSNEEIESFFSDICSGLAHLHRQSILHRDLKPPNLLLKYSGESMKNNLPSVVISDFGECEDLLNSSEIIARSGATGTLEYTAPELLKTDSAGLYYVEFSTSTDLWSLGMILYFLCFSNLPFTDLDDLDTLKLEILQLRKNRVQIPEGVRSKSIHSVLRLLLSPNPNDRPSASVIIESIAKIKRSEKNVRSFVRPLTLPYPFVSPLPIRNTLVQKLPYYVSLLSKIFFIHMSGYGSGMTLKWPFVLLSLIGSLDSVIDKNPSNVLKMGILFYSISFVLQFFGLYIVPETKFAFTCAITTFSPLILNKFYF